MSKARSASTRPLPKLAELSWTSLNDFLRDATEVECEALIKTERAGQFRPLVLNRIVCRFLRMHGERLRRELLSPPVAKKSRATP
jgi:hypothetical protein